MADIAIRQMKLSDVDAVLEVEKSTFLAPWPRDIIVRELTDNDYAHYCVLVIDHQIVGYAGMWHVIDDAQVTSIAITPAFRGRKLGQTLFLHLLEKAIKMGAKRLSLEVRVTNTVAQRMYRKFGLVPGGIRKNYYTDNQEDAIVMWVNLS
ncbi:putative ribosomal-protein-alanine acetyltransferase [Lentibacillus kapialis]|uniref:[Ribosomal protein bS18]-alanine N-acetyltransferase n=1 Tax=Lentibacillus kapialis TaxID=340214 RepID=A0A917PYC3_9BACI|nr:ribosomal protein S18-alanine N-acetyltransferase [Lentibacillus kapialis]GGK00816.1 putative ribosomal-protein-alanine acetyltransferase [Lentibacillus kapialis]